MVIRGIRSSENASFRRFPEIYSQYCFFSLIIIKITIDSENKFEIRRFLLLQLPDVPAILAQLAPAVNLFLSSFSEDSQLDNAQEGTATQGEERTPGGFLPLAVAANTERDWVCRSCFPLARIARLFRKTLNAIACFGIKTHQLCGIILLQPSHSEKFRGRDSGSGFLKKKSSSEKVRRCASASVPWRFCLLSTY